ncbi:MAG: DUF4860 domain-containing protein [Coriobacteriales bacterium]|jgi:hypothetical protein|nr:DUF4860 domain-containing protein [Coriobacteriales bacterium]
MGKQRISDLILVLVLFAVFAIGAMLLSAIGSDVYRSTTANMQKDYDLRTGVLYIVEKIRQNDITDSLRVENVDGMDALVLSEDIANNVYETWIFVNDNMLCETLIASNSELDLATVQRIMPMKNMVLKTQANGCLNVEMTTVNGDKTALTLSLRSKHSDMILTSTLVSALENTFVNTFVSAPKYATESAPKNAYENNRLVMLAVSEGV